MDILFTLGIVVAVLMIAVGVYLFFFSRKPLPPTDAAALEIQPSSVAGRPPVVPRAVRGMLPVADSALLNDSHDANPAAAQPSVARDTSVAAEDDIFARINPQQARTQPTVDQAAAMPITAKAEPQPEPTLLAAREFGALSADTNSLDSMLDDLEQATAKLVTPVERGEVAEWQGDSALLDAHLEDQARRDDESPLAQAEQIVALYVLPTEGRSLEGARVMSLLRQYGLRFGEMSLFHRFAESSGEGRLMFSVLRYTSEGPQGFDLETLPQEKLDGLAFFLALPNPEAVNGYDMMASISSLLARDFSAHLYDEEMNLFTKQLKAHYRHVVLEFKPKG